MEGFRGFRGARVWGLGVSGTRFLSSPIINKGTLFPTIRFQQGDPEPKRAKGHYSGT